MVQAILPSLVMKEMNSETHSCMHSFASFAILAFSGSAFFIIRATGAKLRMLASEFRNKVAVELDGDGENANECWGRGAESDEAPAVACRKAS